MEYGAVFKDYSLKFSTKVYYIMLNVKRDRRQVCRYLKCISVKFCLRQVKLDTEVF